MVEVSTDMCKNECPALRWELQFVIIAYVMADGLLFANMYYMICCGTMNDLGGMKVCHNKCMGLYVSSGSRGKSRM